MTGPKRQHPEYTHVCQRAYHGARFRHVGGLEEKDTILSGYDALECCTRQPWTSLPELSCHSPPEITKVAFSPAESNILYTSSNDGLAFLWNLHGGLDPEFRAVGMQLSTLSIASDTIQSGSEFGLCQTPSSCSGLHRVDPFSNPPTQPLFKKLEQPCWTTAHLSNSQNRQFSGPLTQALRHLNPHFSRSRLNGCPLCSD